MKQERRFKDESEKRGKLRIISTASIRVFIFGAAIGVLLLLIQGLDAMIQHQELILKTVPRGAIDALVLSAFPISVLVFGPMVRWGDPRF